MPTNPEFLKDIVLLHTMDDEERSALANVMEEVRFPADTHLFNEADQGGVCYILRSGFVELTVTGDDNQRVVVDILGPGELFGELSLLDGGLRSTAAHAVSDVEAVALKRGDLLEFLKKKPDAALDIMSALAKRLRNADALLKQRVQDPNLLIEEKVTFADRTADDHTAGSGAVLISSHETELAPAACSGKSASS
jgi:CRP-like cAMP-binding protein